MDFAPDVLHSREYPSTVQRNQHAAPPPRDFESAAQPPSFEPMNAGKDISTVKDPPYSLELKGRGRGLVSKHAKSKRTSSKAQRRRTSEKNALKRSAAVLEDNLEDSPSASDIATALTGATSDPYNMFTRSQKRAQQGIPARRIATSADDTSGDEDPLALSARPPIYLRLGADRVHSNVRS